MRLLISDANILIDLDDGGILELSFQLPLTLQVPDVLLDEELGDMSERLRSLGLTTAELRPEGVSRASELNALYPRTSRMDCMALALAEQQACPLLTGDAALRAAAEHEQVEVRGTIWIVELLIEHGLMTIAATREAYARMRELGSRLPWSLINSRLNALEHGETLDE